MKNLLFNNNYYCSHISRLAGYIYIYFFIELGLMSDQANVSIINQTKKLLDIQANQLLNRQSLVFVMYVQMCGGRYM